MNTRLSALLMASLAGLMFAGPALAVPRFPDGEWLAAREERDFGRWEEREARKAKQQEKRAGQRAEDEERERGYGYGYERRNPQPRHDGRGRR